MSSVEFPHSADQYELLQPIGRGASAVVFRAECIPNKQEVAIKIIDLENCPAEIDDIRREIVQMNLCNHPNVVKSHCSFVNGPYLWLVMDFLAGGSVLDIMKYSRPNGLNDEALIATVLKEALQGIEYLHQTQQIHRDVKAGNLLVSRDGRILLADFGVSALLMESGAKRKSMSFVGTPCWMAPEVMEQVRGYDYKADIWSFGITAVELANGTAPLASYPPMKVLLMTLQNPPPSLEGNSHSRALKDIVELCLQKDPNKRPSATKLLEHKFFKLAKKRDYVVKELLAKLPPIWERVKVTIGQDEDLEARKREILQLDKSAESEAWSFGETLRQKLNVAELRMEAERQEHEERSSSPIPVPSSGTGGSSGSSPVGSAPAAAVVGSVSATPAVVAGSEPTTKGRFSVTTSSTSSTSTSSSSTKTKGRFQISRPTGATAVAATKPSTQAPPEDPMKIYAQLGGAIKRVQEDNERLRAELEKVRAENDKLRKQLAERDAGGAS